MVIPGEPLVDEQVHQIQRLGASSRVPWIHDQIPDEIKWRIAQAVAEVEFALQKYLLEHDAQRTSDFSISLRIEGSCRAISREAGLPEGQMLPPERSYLVTAKLMWPHDD